MSNQNKWQNICELNQILPNMGICALFENEQVAIFRIISNTGSDQLFAISNYCPFSKSNTISRGLTGSVQDKTVVASPLYKQHFDLSTGQCIEDIGVKLKTYAVRIENNQVQVAA